jgi:multiple RNA-binding domain-containing protein 1
MHVLPSKRHPGQESGAAPTDATDAHGNHFAAGFKQQRDEQRRADAGNRAAWNSLFMRSDTVAEAVAAHYGVTKAQLLDREAADLPVRMALGEAQVRAVVVFDRV